MLVCRPAPGAPAGGRPRPAPRRLCSGGGRSQPAAPRRAPPPAPRSSAAAPQPQPQHARFPVAAAARLLGGLLRTLLPRPAGERPVTVSVTRKAPGATAEALRSVLSDPAAPWLVARARAPGGGGAREGAPQPPPPPFVVTSVSPRPAAAAAAAAGAAAAPSGPATRVVRLLTGPATGAALVQQLDPPRGDEVLRYHVVSGPRAPPANQDYTGMTAAAAAADEAAWAPALPRSYSASVRVLRTGIGAPPVAEWTARLVPPPAPPAPAPAARDGGGSGGSGADRERRAKADAAADLGALLDAAVEAARAKAEAEGAAR